MLLSPAAPQWKGSRTWRYVAVVAVLVAGGAVGWIVGGNDKEAQAAVPVKFLPAAAVQDNPFTDPVDVRGDVTIKGGTFGGTGSNLVCDRELLIRQLEAKPDRLRAWAGVVGIEPTLEAVSRYIRALEPATLLAPTRVTNHSYVNGKADAFQALLAPGTAVLVDRQGAIRVRCRCGNPLLDPLVVANERCQGCPGSGGVPASWRLASTYYGLHPSPPPVEGEPRAPGRRGIFEVIRTVPAGVVLEDASASGKTITVPEEKPPETRTVKVTGRTRTVTVTVPRITTVTRVVTVPRTVTQIRTVTVYRGEG